MHTAFRLALLFLPLGDVHAASRVCRSWREWVHRNVSLEALCRRQLGIAVRRPSHRWDDLYRQLAAAGCFVLQRQRQSFRSKRAVVYHKVRHRWKVSGRPCRHTMVCVRKGSGRVDLLRSANNWKRNMHGVVWHLTS